MTIKRVRPLLLLAIGVACTEADGEPALVLQNVAIVDVVKGEVVPAMRVVVTGARIAAVGAAADVAVPRGARVIDARGKFVIPGLWDMHVHLDSWDFEHALPLLLANGVLGVRDMGGDYSRLASIRGRIERGELLGPRVITAGEMLDGPTDDWPYRITVRDSSEARDAVFAHRERGVDFIKVHQQLGRESYFAIAAAVREAGLTFSGHVPSGVTGEEAAAAGQRSIEHLTGTPSCVASADGEAEDTGRWGCSNPALPSAIAAFREHGTWHDPTLAVYEAMRFIDDSAFTHDDRRRYVTPPVQDFWNLQMKVNGPVPPRSRRQGWLDGNLALVAALHRAGVPLLTASDLGFLHTYPGFSLHNELSLLVRAGLSPMEALRASTTEPARFFEREAVWGSIEAGKIADLVVLERNPMDDIEHVRDIAMVITRGRLLDRAALESMLAESIVP